MLGDLKMKIKQVIWLILIFFCVGGCSEINKKESYTDAIPPDTPSDVRVLQDDYTRSFLTSTEEVAAGFYEMRTWTDAYSIWIPSEAKLDKTYYQKREQYWDQFLYTWQDQEQNLSYLLFGLFQDNSDSLEHTLRLLNIFAHYEGEYDQTEDEKHYYYFGKMVSQVGGDEGKEPVPVYVSLGLIKDKNSDKSLGIHYEHHCSDWTTNCHANSAEIEEQFWKIMKSVQFD